MKIIERTPSRLDSVKAWLGEHCPLLIYCLLVYIEVFLALGWGSSGHKMIFWLYMQEKGGLLGLWFIDGLLIITMILISLLAHHLHFKTRFIMVVLFILPQPMIIVRPLVGLLEAEHYLTSKVYQSRMYHLTYHYDYFNDLYYDTGYHYSVFECDRSGVWCRWVTEISWSNTVSPHNAGLTADSSTGTLYIMMGNNQVIGQIPVPPGSPPVDPVPNSP
jgi:hypothetical protein